MYLPLERSAFSVSWYEAVCHSYCNVARRVAAADETVSFKYLTSSLPRGRSGLIANLGNTCKTHKIPGSVKFRYLHLSPAYSFEALATWVVKVLNNRLDSFSHFVGSSTQFMKRVNQFRYPVSAVALHFDLDDFFNTGATAFLAKGASSLAFMKVRAELHEALKLILQHQYVSSEVCEGVWQVLLGSGQGLTPSAAIANACFLMTCEVNGPGLASRVRVRSQWGILNYTRYVDNLLFIVEDISRVEPLVQFLRASLSPYSGKVEEVGIDRFDFLDVHYAFKKFQVSTIIEYSPVMKLDSRFLHPSSSHPRAVHLAWPSAYIQSIWSHSSSLSIFESARKQFLDVLVAQHWPKELVQLFINKSNYIRPFNFQCPAKHLGAKQSANLIWLTLPYHPIWGFRNYVTKALRRINAAEDYRYMLSQAFEVVTPPKLRISWRLTSSPIGHTFNREQ